MSVKLVSCRPFRAEMSARDGRFGIAFNGDQFVVFVEDELAAPYAAIRTNRRRHLRAVVLGTQVARLLRHDFGASAARTVSNLIDEWPAGKQVSEHSLPP